MASNNKITLRFVREGEGYCLSPSSRNQTLDQKVAKNAGRILGKILSRLENSYQIPLVHPVQVIRAEIKPVKGDSAKAYHVQFYMDGQILKTVGQNVVVKLNEQVIKKITGQENRSHQIEAQTDSKAKVARSKPATFGFHAYGSGSQGADAVVRAKNIQSRMWYTRVLHRTLLVASVCLGFLVSLPAAIFVSVGATIAYIISLIYTSQKIGEISGVVTNELHELDQLKLTPKRGVCDALPTEHSADTEVWREKLIEAAQENIIVSGNYCGGDSFIKFLGLIEKRMKEKIALKAVVISSPKFLTPAIREKIQQLQQTFTGRFSLIESPDILYVSPGIKQSTNHTKCMVIDYGKYFILGGSGIKDNFVGTGLDDLTKKEFLKQKYNKEEQETNLYKEGGLISHLIPGNFRDMDFVFSSSSEKNNSGSQVYKQMLLLAYRWEQYSKILNGEEVIAPTIDLNTLGAFSGNPSPLTEKDSVTTALLKTPLPKNMGEIKTQISTFDNHPNKATKAAFKILASGPEQISSAFAEELLEKINEAQTKIVINHMYFHPTDEIFHALKEAANRGVKIQIITCGIYKDCPASHLAFGPRNRYNYATLHQAILPPKKENLEVFEFEQNKKGNHKKVIIVDDQVIAGSSNLGYKSLVTTSDHELNFFVRSKKFAEETMAVCQVDIDHSVKITNFNLTSGEIVKAGIHRILAPFIG